MHHRPVFGLGLAMALVVVAGCTAPAPASPVTGEPRPATTPLAPSTPAAEPANACPPPATMQWTDAVPQDGQFGWVRHFDGQALYLDPAEYFSNEDASAAAVQDGELPEGRELPNPFYLRDPDAAVVRVEVADGFTLVVLQSPSEADQRVLTGAEAARLYCAGADTASWMYSGADGLPVHLAMAAGRASSATETYLP